MLPNSARFAAAQRMILDRTEMREDRDGNFRFIRDPLPSGSKSEAA
jgi:hypothetical protein